MGNELAESLRGATLVPAINDLSALSFARLGTSKAPLQSNLRTLYAQDPQSTSTNPYSRLVHALGPDMLNRVAAIEAIGPAPTTGAGAAYPNTSYGKQLRDVAHIIRSGLGLEVATVDIGGGTPMTIRAPAVGRRCNKGQDWRSSRAGSGRSTTIWEH